MQRIIYILFLLVIGIVSCKSKKPVVAKKQALPKQALESKVLVKEEALFAKIAANKNSSNELSFSSETDYSDGKQSISLNMDVVAKKGQYVFLNAKALGLVNVARVMIQPDSIRILDMINRNYISASYSFMKGFTNAPLGFTEIQNLVWANAMFDPKLGKTRVDSLTQMLILILDLGGIQQKAVYNSSLKTQSVSLSEQVKSQEMLVKFGDFKNLAEIVYPHEIVINIQGEKKIECKFSISNFATTIKKEPQFVVPRSYKVKVY
ncbi:MAG: DUF4292 domain-containing protein [bacterium]|nr:DUF4292 domain-containing protein [bacterium]